MKNLLTLLLIFVFTIPIIAQERLEYAFVVHGGAGNISPKFISPEREKAITEKLSEALETGIDILDACIMDGKTLNAGAITGVCPHAIQRPFS